MRISTKKGDKGETSLFNGRKVKKSDSVIEVLGNLDELNSFLGFAKCADKDVYNFDILNRAQKDIYRMMSVIGNEMKPPKEIKSIGDEDVKYLETQIEKFENSMGVNTKFIIPGESEFSARMHLARSVCRRGERSAFKAESELKIPAIFLKYLNRLSDLLFLIAQSSE
jgi:cob(I)alamin adenosyltransferase